MSCSRDGPPVGEDCVWGEKDAESENAGDYPVAGLRDFHVWQENLNMHAVISSPDHDRLFAIAESQDGYFTMAQALEAGFARSTHSYHVKAGNWVREQRGIYRLRRFPITETGYLVPWALWSRNRRGEIEGVYSHTTALALRNLSDANPSKLHMTVPPGFRRNSETPPVLVLHKARLAPDEMIQERGYALTSPMRAIIDSAASGDADPDMLRHALDEGMKRGLITRRELREAVKRTDLTPWLSELLHRFES